MLYRYFQKLIISDFTDRGIQYLPYTLRFVRWITYPCRRQHPSSFATRSLLFNRALVEVTIGRRNEADPSQLPRNEQVVAVQSNEKMPPHDTVRERIRYSSRTISLVIVASIGLALVTVPSSAVDTESSHISSGYHPPRSVGEAAEQIQTLRVKTRGNGTGIKAQLFDLMGSLNYNTKKDKVPNLKQTLNALVALAPKKRGFMEQISGEARRKVLDRAAALIDAELCAHGKAPKCEANAYKPWKEVTEELLAEIEPNKRLLERGAVNEDFVTGLSEITNSRFVGGNDIKLLIDGPACFDKRRQLFEGAQQSIWLTTWAIYDDEAGRETVDRLLAKHADGLDVRVLVDGTTSQSEKFDDRVAELKEKGVPMVRYFNPSRRGDGNHRKLFIVDGQHVIAGGMNIGDPYAHVGEYQGEAGWRDTDVYLRGPAVEQAVRLFAEVWNNTIKMNRLRVSPIEPPRTGKGSTHSGSMRVAVVNHTPGEDANYLLGALTAFYGATRSIEIEHAYFIAMPAIQQALGDALLRGVKVRIHTNSINSIDEKIIMVPILQSLPKLIRAGAEVYLKQGSTLHSKFYVVDRTLASVSSYNIHPRSYRYEGEVAIQILDSAFAAKLSDQFQTDVQGLPLTQPELQIPETPLTWLIQNFLYDQL